MTHRAEWYGFYDSVFEKVLELNIQPCPIAKSCHEQNRGCCVPDQWPTHAGLPWEIEWAAGCKKGLPDGCGSCGKKKTLICTMWPVLSMVSSNGDYMVKLLLSCDGLFVVPEYFAGIVELAEDIGQLLSTMPKYFRVEYMEGLGEIVGFADDTSIDMRPGAAEALLRDPRSRRLLRTLLEYGRSNEHMLDVVDTEPLYKVGE